MLDKPEIIFPCKRKCGKIRACKSMKKCKNYQNVLLQLRTAVLDEIQQIQENYGEYKQ